VDIPGRARDADAAVFVQRLTIDSARFPCGDAYPFNLRLMQETKSLDLSSPVTFFAGENGSGKSTLLFALARRCQIHIWQNSERSRGHANVFEDRLHECLDIEPRRSSVAGCCFSAEIFRGFAELVDAWAASDPGLFAYFGGSSLTQKSHGQCNMAFFKSRFQRPGLYLLDEPESALSARRQIELLGILGESSAAGAQFVVATHSPILMSLPGARIYSFDHCPVAKVDYHATDAYRLHVEFFRNLTEKAVGVLGG
jgi:predicted ATPase